MDRRSESLDAFKNATTLTPLEAGVWAGYGASLMEAQDVEQACHFYETAVFLDPDNAQYLTELATAYAAVQRWKDAEGKFTGAVRFGASGFNLYFSRGLCRLKLYDFVSAADDLRVALEFEPTHRRADEARELLRTIRSTGVNTDDRFRFGDL